MSRVSACQLAKIADDMIQERNADRFVETDIALPKQVCSSCSSDNLAFAIWGTSVSERFNFDGDVVFIQAKCQT